MSPLIHLAGHGWTLLLDPERGAKITSLRDPSGREWLAQAQEAAGRAQPGASFVEAEMAGWDECAPTVIACEIDGQEIPDHGSLWDRPFEVTREARGDLLRAVDERLGFELTRRVTIDADGVLLEYAVVVTRRQPFLWAAHPQFVSPAGSTVELPDGLTRLIDVTSRPTVEVGADELHGGAAEQPAYSSRKFYLHPDDRADNVVLRHRDGVGLEMTWSEECQYLGIWLDNAHYSREPVVALEPSTGYFDSLSDAADARLVPWLEPGSPFTWWVRLAQAAPVPTSRGDRS